MSSFIDIVIYRIFIFNKPLFNIATISFVSVFFENVLSSWLVYDTNLNYSSDVFFCLLTIKIFFVI